MALPNLGSLSSPTSAASSTTLSQDDPNRKVRKQYTISKSRESWTEPEHDKFMEAIQLFDRDWKKIEAFIGSKSVIQNFRLSIRGTNVDSVRDWSLNNSFRTLFKVLRGTIRSNKLFWNKYSAACEPSDSQSCPEVFYESSKEWDQGTSTSTSAEKESCSSLSTESFKNFSAVGGVLRPMSSPQASPLIPDNGSVSRPDTSASLRHSDTAASLPCLIDNSVKKGDVRSGGQSLPGIYCCCRSDSNPRARPTVLPDFAQVYNFIGSVFDPNVTGHLQKLKKMDQIDVETALLLMRNLSINLSSPDFEDHRRLLSTHEIDQRDNAYDAVKHIRTDQIDDSA